MQALGAVTYDDLKCPGQEILTKLEVYDGATWWDLCNLHEALIDGGLEDWASATNLTSWIEGVVGTSTVNRDAADVHGGTYSVRLDISAGNDYAAIQQSDVPLHRPFDYCLSGWYKTEAGKTAQIELINSGVADVYLKEDGTWTTDVTFIHLPAATSWTRFAYQFTPHPAYTLYNVAFLRYSAASSSIWFDDLSISAWPPNRLVDGALAIELGGAGVSPDPVAATWSAEVSNDDSAFHPRHPYSEFSELLRVGRQVRISVGAKYAGVDKYWQRLIGFMDAPQFNNSKRTISISGGDYTKVLMDTLLRSPGNYWGSTATFSTVATSSSLGAEIYDEADALEIGAHEANNITNWTDDAACTASSTADAGGGSTYVMLVTKDTNVTGYVENANVGAVTAGAEYECSFKYILALGEGGGSLQALVYTGAALDGYSGAGTSEAWVSASFRFTASATTNLKLKFRLIGESGTEARIDQVSVKPVTTPGINTIYILPDASMGAYYATLDGLPIYKNDPPEKYGWGNVDGSNAFYFVNGTVVTAGTNNLVVYYYTEQAPENVVADLLAAGPYDLGGGAGLYANRAAALAAMTYTATGTIVDKVWFEAGYSILSAIQKLCERCDYRFWFDETGVPHFEPAPTHRDPSYWLESGMFADSGEFQEPEEIRNRIALEGIERAVYGPAGEVENSRFKSTASDATSIAAYRERTYSSTNDLFQDQDALDAAAAAMLAAYKDPKWYSDLRVSKNAAPVQRGDSIEWDVELAPASGSTAALKNTLRGIVRDASFSGDGFNYKCEIRSKAMNIANYAAGPVTVTAEHCRGWMLTNAGAGADLQFNLPAATVGMEITFYVLAAQTLTVNPNGTERISVLTGTAGDYLRSDAVIGSYIKLTCLVVGYWHKTDLSGTWTEEA